MVRNARKVNIHHTFLISVTNGLFHEASAGCNFDVHPPGITHRSELYFIRADSLMDGVICALKASQTRKRRFWLFKLPSSFQPKVNAFFICPRLFSQSTQTLPHRLELHFLVVDGHQVGEQEEVVLFRQHKQRA